MEIKREKNPIAVALGSIKTEKKTRASRENVKKAAAAPRTRPTRVPALLFNSPCTCGTGDVVDGHKSKCPRYHLIFKRRKNKLDPMTGKPLEMDSQVVA
jgi:hypothetical protein